MMFGIILWCDFIFFVRCEYTIFFHTFFPIGPLFLHFLREAIACANIRNGICFSLLGTELFGLFVSKGWNLMDFSYICPSKPGIIRIETL